MLTLLSFISKLRVEDQVVTSQDDKHRALFNYYNTLLGTIEDWPFTLNLDSLQLSLHDLLVLDEPFTEAKVRDTAKKLTSDNAPSLDGFTDHFYRT